MTVWHDSIAVLGNTDVVLRAVVVTVCVHVVHAMVLALPGRLMKASLLPQIEVAPRKQDGIPPNALCSILPCVAVISAICCDPPGHQFDLMCYINATCRAQREMLRWLVKEFSHFVPEAKCTVAEEDEDQHFSTQS